MIALEKSSTLYIGNLAFSTQTMHIRSHFSQMGPVKAVHLGLNKNTRTPCGFAFVEYYDRRNALDAVAYLTGTKLDGRVIRVELDAGFKPGREFGRGTTGGQMRDERRRMVDPARSKRDTATPNSGTGLQEEGRGAVFGGPDKRDRGDDYQAEDDQPEKNPRFREE
jgi:nuclear cap-binding protein subunit 2